MHSTMIADAGGRQSQHNKYIGMENARCMFCAEIDPPAMPPIFRILHSFEVHIQGNSIPILALSASIFSVAAVPFHQQGAEST